MKLYNADCLEVLRVLPNNSIHSVVTDPPYGISFSNKDWDKQLPSSEVWRECLRVLKPGGYLLAFSSTRTYHRATVNIEDAGFDIRGMLSWAYIEGFPKSHNIASYIQSIKDTGQSRAVIRKGIGNLNGDWSRATRGFVSQSKARAITHPDALKWEGWGTGLKPAIEPITLARKQPQGSSAENALVHGTGGFNIEACKTEAGYWPADFLHDGSQDLARFIPDAALPFFFCPKPDKLEKNGVKHPTMKPVDLMRYLCKLITPKGGVVLDPFLGSGTTGVACGLEGFDFIGVEREKTYFDGAHKRIASSLCGTREQVNLPVPPDSEKGVQ